MKAALVYLGPLTEELLFRAGLFGTLRHKNRAAAYAVSMLAFSVYHVWGYALDDPGYWIFLLQYLPARAATSARTASGAACSSTCSRTTWRSSFSAPH